MKMLITTLFVIFSAYLAHSQIEHQSNYNKEFCSFFDIGASILQKDTSGLNHDSLIESALWNGYNVNLPNFGFPDSVFLSVTVGSWACAFDAVTKPGNFLLSVYIFLVFSEGDYCLVLKNPIVSDSISLSNEVMENGNDFYNQLGEYQNIERIFTIPLKELVDSWQDINYRGEDYPYYLSQIEVLVKIQSLNKTETCTFLYRHPVCSSVPKTIYNWK